MSILRKIGLALVGADYIAQLENTAAKQVLDAATPGIKTLAIAELTDRQCLRHFLERVLGQADTIAYLGKVSKLSDSEKNVIKLKAAVTKLVSADKPDLSNRELSLIAEVLIGLVSIAVFTPNTKA